MPEVVYLETSVISALFDQRMEPVCRVQHAQTRQWHEEQSSNYELVTSVAVIDELKSGTYKHQSDSLAYARNLEQIAIDDEVFGVARVYVDRRIMPKETAGDAVHIAAASVHGVDYLLTWNCRHLANPHKVRRLAEINRRLGLLLPSIVTPSMLYVEDDN